MTDVFLELGKRPGARRLIKRLGLPLPMPVDLERAEGPWRARELEGRTFELGATEGAALVEPTRAAIEAAGAEVSEGGSTDERRLVHGLVFDGSALSSPRELAALHAFFHPRVGWVRPSGRILVLARPPEASRAPAEAATRRAIEGFVRSLAKEVGRRGATAHVVHVAEGAEARLAPLLRFLLSPRSAFISGQPFFVDGRVAGASDPTFERALEHKVVLVTGAARGIGAETARLAAAEGAKVLCLDRPEDGDTLREVARAVGGRAIEQDVSAPDAPARLVDALGDEGLDVVIHNAGVTRDRTLAKMSAERFAQAIDINLGAVLAMDAAFAAGPLRDGGRIICLSSVAGLAGNMGQTNYAASKAGLVGYVAAQATALADRGITVNAIAPGFIETRLTAAIPVMIREAGRRLSNLGQGGQPSDIGELAVFLASPGSSGLTGQVIRACGGALIGA